MGPGFESPLGHHVVADFISFATTFYLKKSSLIHFVAPPFRIEPACAGLRLGFESKPGSVCLESERTAQVITSVISLATSFLCSASKTHRALILLLLASKSQPLRWASIWFWNRPFREIVLLLHRYTSEQSPLCSGVLLFLHLAVMRHVFPFWSYKNL